eukprot:381344_1
MNHQVHLNVIQANVRQAITIRTARMRSVVAIPNALDRPKGPESLVEFTLSQSFCSNDFYDVSLIDGYNIPVSVEPFDYTLSDVIGYTGDHNKYQCGTAKINTFDAASECPTPLLFHGTKLETQVQLILIWWNNTDATDILIPNYSASQLAARYV